MTICRSTTFRHRRICSRLTFCARIRSRSTKLRKRCGQVGTRQRQLTCSSRHCTSTESSSDATRRTSTGWNASQGSLQTRSWKPTAPSQQHIASTAQPKPTSRGSKRRLTATLSRAAPPVTAWSNPTLSSSARVCPSASSTCTRKTWSLRTLCLSSGPASKSSPSATSRTWSPITCPGSSSTARLLGRLCVRARTQRLRKLSAPTRTLSPRLPQAAQARVRIGTLSSQPALRGLVCQRSLRGSPAKKTERTGP
mmetsp:Transcript_891/g.1850  ORF Transcript_891/g.1850 Transcript_891/m.1850 type:complete len:253 (+) Transcript_891:532-1290(+)